MNDCLYNQTNNYVKECIYVCVCICLGLHFSFLYMYLFFILFCCFQQVVCSCLSLCKNNNFLYSIEVQMNILSCTVTFWCHFIVLCSVVIFTVRNGYTDYTVFLNMDLGRVVVAAMISRSKKMIDSSRNDKYLAVSMWRSAVVCFIIGWTKQDI